MPIPTVLPEAAGFSADLADRLDAGIRSGLLRHLHAVLVSRGGALVLERYCEGPDESWGRPLGAIACGPDTLHDLRSVTKSVVGLLYGIALDRGLVPPPDAPLLAQFPEYPDLAADPRRARLTVGHALTMTLGTQWDEQRPYTDPANSEIAMENAPDRNRFVLDRPIVAEAGTRWIYSGGAVALVGALIARGCGDTLPDFARHALFGPLGIGEFEWAAGRDGVASAAWGLRLRARDLLRIGTLVLAGGTWEGRRVVSRAWLDAALAPAIATGDGLHYGRLWFLGDAPVPAFAGARRWIAGFGNGGQRLWLLPDAGVAAVIFSGNYNSPDGWITPTRIWREIVLANLVRA
ncbi:MAG: beta-lactamase family protein [Alphaproteobacteria bacterium]|nr:beta-lactamase family protein [Alphaproteobacteria bacterium]